MMQDYTKIVCNICGEGAHFLEVHLNKAHNMTIEEYLTKYPDAMILSKAAEEKLAAIQKQARREKVMISVRRKFGIVINDSVKEVLAFAEPHQTTPKIDLDYVFDQKNLALCLFAMQTPCENTLLTGATGSGKSSIIEQVAARLNWPFYRVNFDGDITRADLVGQWVLKGEQMTFQYGILAKAMMEGAVICLDEWDCINPSVGMVLQPVLEGKPLTITETGDIIEPHPDFRVFATSNTIGQGDETGLYNGTQPQNFATLDRFNTVGIVDYLDKKIETEILIRKAGTDKDAASKIIEVATLMRNAFKKGQTVATMSTRTIVNIAKKIAVFGDIKIAYEVAFLNKLNADDKAVGYEFIQRVWGKI